MSLPTCWCPALRRSSPTRHHTTQLIATASSTQTKTISTRKSLVNKARVEPTPSIVASVLESMLIPTAQTKFSASQSSTTKWGKGLQRRPPSSRLATTTTGASMTTIGRETTRMTTGDTADTQTTKRISPRSTRTGTTADPERSTTITVVPTGTPKTRTEVTSDREPTTTAGTIAGSQITTITTDRTWTDNT